MPDLHDTDPGRGHVAGVVLAAGRSTRFDARLPKQLHKVNGETLVCRVARAATASKLCQIVVVAGHYATEVGAAVAGLAVEVVENPGYASGQAGSVKTGLSRVEPSAVAAMFIPCDLLNLEADTIDRLIGAYAESGGPIVVPVVAGQRRAPVVLDRRLFDEIADITGDQGARQLFSRHEDDIVEVGFDSPRPFEDLDQRS